MPHLWDPAKRATSKRRKLQEDRAAEIALENRILLQKMLEIDTKPSQFSGDALSSQRVHPRSLHGGYHNRQHGRITTENQKLMHRIFNVKGTVDAQKCVDDEYDRQALKIRMAQNSGNAPLNLRLPNLSEAVRLPPLHKDWGQLPNHELAAKLDHLEKMNGAVDIQEFS
jgi:hypothetical protein